MTHPTTTFGDATPEDAWHPDDPLPVLIRNVARRVALLDGGDVVERLDVLADRLAAWIESPQPRSEADAVRARLASVDLEWIGNQ